MLARKSCSGWATCARAPRRFHWRFAIALDNRDWWRHDIFYQIYPRSFQDFDGDGVGDINGILGRVSYEIARHPRGLAVANLPAPDGGFRLRHFRLHQHRAVVRQNSGFRCTGRGCACQRPQIILDLLPNHTSDRHPLFMDARASRDPPKRGWYIWRDPKPNGGPSKQLARGIRGSAWQ